MPSRTWLITGVSSGFGSELTRQLLAVGDRVAGTVRDTAKVADLTGQHPGIFIPDLPDMTDTTAIRQLTGRCWQRLGRIDVIISNVGYGLFGAAGELSDVQVNGTLSPYVTIWSVRRGDDIYIRSAYGPGNGWYRRAKPAGPAAYEPETSRGTWSSPNPPPVSTRPSTRRTTRNTTATARRSSAP